MFNKNKNKAEIKDSNGNTIIQNIIETQNNINKIDFNREYLAGLLMNDHPLNPDFKIGIDKLPNGKMGLKSVPISDDAMEKYPMSIKGKFTVVDEKYKNYNNVGEVLKQMYYNQESVKVDLKSLDNFLGEIKDPFSQFDSLDIVESYIVPEKFPDKEFPVSFEFKNSKFKLDYVSLKLVRKLSEKVSVLNNSHQEYPFTIEMTLDFEGNNTSKLNFKMRESYTSAVSSMIKYIKFVINLSSKQYIIKSINDNKEFITGKAHLDISKEEKEFNKHYLVGLEKIIEIEEYTGIKFDLTKGITSSDVKDIDKLFEYIKASKRKQRLKQYSVDLDKKEMDVNQVRELCNSVNFKFTFVLKDLKFTILGEDIFIDEIDMDYYNLQVSNKEEVLSKLKDINNDDSDKLELMMIPSLNEKIIREIKIINRLSED